MVKPISLVLSALLIISSLSVSPAWSQAPSTPVKKIAKKKRPPTKADSTIKIVYASSPWNKNSTQLDSAFLFMKDSQSGKTVKIVLEESEPDSSTFEGYFSIDWAKDAEKLAPEIYIPSQNLRGEQGLTRFHHLLSQGKLQRRPVVVKKTASGMQVIDVYDTNEQVKRALEAYKEEKRIAQEKKKSLTKPIPSEATLEAARMAERKVQLEKLALEAAQRATERVRLEQIERQRTEERIRKAKLMAEKERKARKHEAFEIAEHAMKLYKEGKFKEAEGYFRQSIELDPDNKSYYFRYGVTLYRNNKYNEALVILKLAADQDDVETEKKYYIALTHYRLKELDSALKMFREVKAKNTAPLSSSSAFYEGLILFSQENYEEAQAPFEYVLDHSKDPSLDEKAEEYIERIQGLKRFKKLQEKRTTLTATVGATYDSNILLAPDSVTSQGSATDAGDLRGLFAGSAEYRMIYEREYEWSAKLSTMAMMTASAELSRADPTLAILSTPYSHKGTWGTKGYKLTFNPGYQVLFMDPTSSGVQTNILRSPFLTTEGTLIMSQKWFSTYSLDVRQDDSLLADSIGPNDTDALKVTLNTKQTVFRDKAKKQAVITSLGLITNMAKGDNKTYYRLDAGVTYMTPTQWDAIWTGGLNVFRLEYPTDTNGRKDTNLTVLTGISKPVKEWFIWGVNATYSVNNSTVANNQYSKYTILTTATFNYSL